MGLRRFELRSPAPQAGRMVLATLQPRRSFYLYGLILLLFLVLHVLKWLLITVPLLFFSKSRWVLHDFGMGLSHDGGYAE
jgi:hypothetical protein